MSHPSSSLATRANIPLPQPGVSDLGANHPTKSSFPRFSAMGHSIPAFLAGSLRDQDKACLWILCLELAPAPRTYPLVLGKKTGKLPGYFCGVFKQTQTCDTRVTEVTSLLYLKCHPWERLRQLQLSVWDLNQHRRGRFRQTQDQYHSSLLPEKQLSSVTSQSCTALWGEVGTKNHLVSILHPLLSPLIFQL